MEFFEKIGDAASKTYKFTAEKTSKIAKETKTKMQINEYKSDIKDLYIEIGENVYEKYIKNEELDLSDLNVKCDMIQDLSNKIIECKDEILKLREKRQCKNCYEEIELNSNFCPNCGMKQEEIEKTENDENKIEYEERTEASMQKSNEETENNTDETFDDES